MLRSAIRSQSHVSPARQTIFVICDHTIEAQFKIQLRLADFKFEQAEIFEEIQALHAEFIETFNTTPHWAHKERPDRRRTPITVLAWVRGREADPELLQQLFQVVRFDRTINRHGFVSIQRYYLYAEQGLSRKRISIWIYEGQLQIEYQHTMLAQYACDYDQHQKQLQDVSRPMVFQTPFQSPQMVLFELDDEQWLKIRQRTYQRRQKRLAKLGRQLPLPQLDVAI